MDACYKKNMPVEREKKKTDPEGARDSLWRQRELGTETHFYIFILHSLRFSLPPCRFCVGDKFFLKNNMILCQLDYEGSHLPNGGGEMRP